MSNFFSPFQNYKFKVEVNDLGEMEFSEASGGEDSFESFEYREANYINASLIKEKGIFKYGNITLKYGVTSDTKIRNWLKAVGTANIGYKDVVISLLADDYKTVLATWTLEAAMPIKLVLSDFNASCDVLAIESLDLTCKTIVRG